MSWSAVQVAQLAVRPAVATRWHPRGEGSSGGVGVDAPGPLPLHVAVAGVDTDGRGVAVEPVVEEPIRWCRPGLLADFPLPLLALLGGDPPAGAFQVLLLDALQEPQKVETGRLIVHAFDSMMTGMNETHPGRYHLLLTSGGQSVQHGWWDLEATARRKFTAWVGDWGQPGARVTLTDEETGEQLDEWPAVVSPGP